MPPSVGLEKGEPDAMTDKKEHPQTRTIRWQLFYWLTMPFIVAGCATPGGVNVPEGFYSIAFYTIGGKIPIIKAILNEKPAWFIVDTGATVTMLNAAESKYFGFGIRSEASELSEITGFSDKVTLSETFLCTIEIGHLKISQRAWQTREMNALFFTIAHNEKIRIAGVLGSDILARYKINVNYDTKTLSYRIPVRH